MNERTGERLRALRARAKLNKSECERLAGLCQGHVWQIEKRDTLRWDKARQLAALFGTTVEYMLLGKGQPPSDRRLAEAVRSAKRSRKAGKGAQ